MWGLGVVWGGVVGGCGDGWGGLGVEEGGIVAGEGRGGREWRVGVVGRKEQLGKRGGGRCC